MILALLSTFALAEPQTVSSDIHEAVQTTADVAHTVSAVADAAATQTLPAEVPIEATKLDSTSATPTETHASDIVASSKPDVNPTLQYLLEEFKSAMKTGLPLASEGVKSVCFQIQMMGVGLIAFGLFKLGILIYFLSKMKTMWLYGTELNKGRTSYQENPFPQLGAIILGIILCVAIGFTIDSFTEPIMMAGAPVVWALEHIFGMSV